MDAVCTIEKQHCYRYPVKTWLHSDRSMYLLLYYIPFLFVLSPLSKYGGFGVSGKESEIHLFQKDGHDYY